MYTEPMPHSPGQREIEIKLRLRSPKDGLSRLENAGFRLYLPRVLERNVIWDTSNAHLRNTKSLLRIRTAGTRNLITFKGPYLPGAYKSREEIETEVSDASAFGQILTRLGYEPTFRYEKYRTEYVKPGSSGLALLDETPIGAFLELEGEPAWIDYAAAALGFSPADYLTASYAALFFEFRKEHPSLPPHMVFADLTPQD